jgi:hypothetical protein
MSDYKFVVYEKLDGDLHTDSMLERDHGVIPEEVTDKQLKPHHVGSEDATMEKLLEQTRLGSVESITEKNLNESKDQFGSKHRNPSAYEGDINKIEEQRIANKNVESEEYEVASETPKRQRWWEVKTKDGLKVAFKKEAQSGDYLDDVDWEMLEREQDGDFNDDEYLDNIGDDFPVDDMEFEVDDLGDFSIDEYGADDSDLLKEISFNQIDVGGTPTSSGVIEVSDPNIYDTEFDPNLESDLREFMSINHPELEFSLKSFDFSKLSEGIVSYTVGGGVTASNNFPITVASKKK